MLEFIEKVEAATGRSGMNADEAMTYLAEHGDEEAKMFLDQFSRSEDPAYAADVEAAVRWHPDWHEDEHGVIHSPHLQSDDDALPKLVEAYRRSRDEPDPPVAA